VPPRLFQLVVLALATSVGCGSASDSDLFEGPGSSPSGGSAGAAAAGGTANSGGTGAVAGTAGASAGAPAGGGSSGTSGAGAGGTSASGGSGNAPGSGGTGGIANMPGSGGSGASPSGSGGSGATGGCDFSKQNTSCAAKACDSCNPDMYNTYCGEACQALVDCIAEHLDCSTDDDPLCILRSPMGTANVCTVQGDFASGYGATPTTLALELIDCICDG
jgi:hypothetical protein